jgi:histidinol-phosphate aminotransferase
MIPPMPVLRAVQPYVPGEQPRQGRVVKLNTNEFPYPAAPGVLEAIRREAADTVRLYPSFRCDRVRELLAAHHGVGPENILVGNGSDEILRLVIQAWCGRGRTAAMVEPSYSLFSTLITLTEATLIAYRLIDDATLPREMFERRWDLLLLPVPNPPLGTAFSTEEIERLAGGDSIVLIDEAYQDFSSRPSAIGMIERRPNMIVSRTFSKSFGLAGLRVGYAVGSPEAIQTLSRIADVYNVDRISQSAAAAAVESAAYYRQKVELIRRDREWLAEELRRRGFQVPPSEGNFVFARRADAEKLQGKLREQNILVRRFAGTPWADGLRITIGTREELETMLAALDG